MHRTQISLQEIQYQYLQQKAAKAHISLSSVIRNLIDNNMKCKTKTKSKIEKLIGIAKGSGEAIGKHHDLFLYGGKT